MRFLGAGILFALLFPTFVFGAGFAKESLFLSKSPVIEGETVFIHAVVANESQIKFTGEVVFRDKEEKIGVVAVTIAPGGAQAVSVSWKPSPGSHEVSAELTAGDGTVVEKQSANFSIQEKLKPEAPQTPSEVESSENIKKVIAGFSPGVANATAPVFATIDSLRSKGADLLDTGIAWAKKKVEGKGEVKGTSTDGQAASEGIVGTIWYFVSTILLYFFTLLRFLIGNAGIFYPLLAALFFFALWKMYRKMRRPSYSN